MKLFDQLLKVENDFFAEFGYYPQKTRYPERHPILDFRDYHWLLSRGHDNALLICWAPEPFTDVDLEAGDHVYAEAVLDWLGANSRTGAKGGVWRGAEYTLVASSLPYDGDRHYLLFSNAQECCIPVLSWQASA
jgi:hypothetical protein